MSYKLTAAFNKFLKHIVTWFIVQKDNNPKYILIPKLMLKINGSALASIRRLVTQTIRSVCPYYGLSDGTKEQERYTAILPPKRLSKPLARL